MISKGESRSASEKRTLGKEGEELIMEKELFVPLSTGGE